jgi:hypothetical protein
MLVAGEADGSDKGGTRMDQNAEKEQMQEGRRSGVLRAADGWCNWFADGVDAYLLLAVYLIFVEAG